MTMEDRVYPALPSGWPNMSSYDQVADLLKVSKSALYYRVSRGMVPQPVYMGASARFSAESVQIMLAGISPIGTYKRSHSVRVKGGKKGGKRAARNRRTRAAKDAAEQKGGE